MRGRRAAAGLLILLAGGAQAKPRSGIVSTDFLGKPSGARFLGLGETGAVLPGTPQAPLYNPAALEFLPTTFFALDFDMANQSRLPKEVILNASSLRGRRLSYLGFAAPGKAVFYRPLAAYDDTTVTVSTDPANNFIQDTLSIHQFGLGASQKADRGYTVGLNLSYLNARRGRAVAATGQPPVLEMASGNGFSLDWGFRDEEGPFTYGLGVFNFPGLIYWDRYKTDQLPVLVRAGLAFRPFSAVTFSSDYEKKFLTGDLARVRVWHFGLEVVPTPWLALRTGSQSEDFNDRNKTIYTYGLGMMTPQRHTLELSVRLEHLQDQLVHRYGLSFLFPISTPEQAAGSSSLKKPVRLGK